MLNTYVCSELDQKPNLENLHVWVTVVVCLQTAISDHYVEEIAAVT